MNSSLNHSTPTILSPEEADALLEFLDSWVDSPAEGNDLFCPSTPESDRPNSPSLSSGQDSANPAVINGVEDDHRASCGTLDRISEIVEQADFNLGPYISPFCTLGPSGKLLRRTRRQEHLRKTTGFRLPQGPFRFEPGVLISGPRSGVPRPSQEYTLNTPRSPFHSSFPSPSDQAVGASAETQHPPISGSFPSFREGPSAETQHHPSTPPHQRSSAETQHHPLTPPYQRSSAETPHRPSLPSDLEQSAETQHRQASTNPPLRGNPPSPLQEPETLSVPPAARGRKRRPHPRRSGRRIQVRKLLRQYLAAVPFLEAPLPAAHDSPRNSVLQDVPKPPVSRGKPRVRENKLYRGATYRIVPKWRLIPLASIPICYPSSIPTTDPRYSVYIKKRAQLLYPPNSLNP